MNKCFVDYRISKEEISNLSLENLDIIKVLPSKNLYKAIDGHPDIQLNILSNNTLIAHEELFKNLKSYASLNKFNLKLVKAKTNLKNTYPYDISLNAVNLKDFFIHNLKYTDEYLLNSVKEKNLINVKQGYTKCSCAVISNNAIITSDVGLYNENLARTEDNEMHYRMKKSGYKFLLSPNIKSYRYVRSNLRQMIKQKYGNGKWIGVTMYYCPKCFSIYHFVPLLFVLGILFSLIMYIMNIPIFIFLLLASYLLFNLLNVLLITIKNGFHISYLLLPIIFFMLHFAYGFGTIIGLIKGLFIKGKKN